LAELAFLTLVFVLSGRLCFIRFTIFEEMLADPGNFMGGCDRGLHWACAGTHAAVVGANGARGAGKGLGSLAKGLRGAIDNLAHPGT